MQYDIGARRNTGLVQTALSSQTQGFNARLKAEAERVNTLAAGLEGYEQGLKLQQASRQLDIQETQNAIQQRRLLLEDQKIKDKLEKEKKATAFFQRLDAASPEKQLAIIDAAGSQIRVEYEDEIADQLRRIQGNEKNPPALRQMAGKELGYLSEERELRAKEAEAGIKGKQKEREIQQRLEGQGALADQSALRMREIVDENNRVKKEIARLRSEASKKNKDAEIERKNKVKKDDALDKAEADLTAARAKLSGKPELLKPGAMNGATVPSLLEKKKGSWMRLANGTLVTKDEWEAMQEANVAAAEMERLRVKNQEPGSPTGGLSTAQQRATIDIGGSTQRPVPVASPNINDEQAAKDARDLQTGMRKEEEQIESEVQGVIRAMEDATGEKKEAWRKKYRRAVATRDAIKDAHRHGKLFSQLEEPQKVRLVNRWLQYRNKAK